MRKTSPTRYVIQNLSKNNTIKQTKDTDVQDTTTTSDTKTGISEFGEKTTVHGLRYALQLNISSIRRLIWVAVLLACAGMLLFQIIDRVMYFYSLPMDVNFRVNYNTSLLFPAVTICNQNSFKTTLANQSNLYHLLEKLYDSSSTVTADDLQFYNAANISLDTIFLLAAHKKEDFITKCYWKGKKCGPEDFDLIATDHGICYTFNNRDVGKRISSVGSENGLRLTLNVEQYEYMAGPRRDTAGVKMMFHSRGDIPRVNTLGHAVTTGTHVFVGLKMIHVNNLFQPHGTCTDLILEYVDHYTVAGCEMDCLTRLANNTCKCRHMYMLHKNGVPPICSLYQYVTCLKPLLEQIVNLSMTCHCPVQCTFRSYETEISYGSTPMNAMKQFVDENGSKELSSARLEAMEVTSRMNNATLQKKASLIYEFIHSLSDIEEVLLVNLSDRFDEISNVLNDAMIITQNLFNAKTFLYNFQIYIVQKNFIGARDVMEDQTIQDVVLAYINFIMNVEKSIRLLTDRNLTDPSVRLMIHRSTSLILTARIEMIQRAYVNYTTLKWAYDTGSPIFNYSFRNLPREFNKPATPKYLLVHATVHNNYSRVYGKRLFAELTNLRRVLKTLLNLANQAYMAGFVDNDDLISQRELYQSHMRQFVFARSVFNIETVEWPLGVLQTRLHNFNSMWHHYSEVEMRIQERLHAMQGELHNMKTSFFLPLTNIKEKMSNFIVFQNETQISISELLTSERIKEGIYFFKTYFQRLNTNGVALIDWVQHTEKEVLELWKTVVEDEDSTEYHSYMNQYQFTRGFSDIKKEVISNFTYLENLCHFHTIIANKELFFINALTKLIDEAKAYRQFATIDGEFVRDNFLQLDVFFKQLSYEEIQQQIAYDIFALVCDIGGSMGLLLGASVLSVFEIVEFISIQTFFSLRSIF